MESTLEVEEGAATAVQITVNGTPRQLALRSLETGGKAEGSALAKCVLGTPGGLQGSSEITFEPGLEIFDNISAWLETNNDNEFISILLTEDNYENLLEASEYFGLELLQRLIRDEMIRRRNTKEQTLYKLESEAEQWRALHEKIQRAREDQDQGSNTAPAFSFYMYQHREQFIAPTRTSALRSLEEPTFRTYVFQLEQEIEQWESNARHFARLLKRPGNVVYHPSRVTSPGYCVPSLIPSGPKGMPMALKWIVGGAVGDRVEENLAVKVSGRRGKQCAFPTKPDPPRRRAYDSDDSDDSDLDLYRYARQHRAQRGTITSIDEDGGTEMSVKWDEADGGGVSHKIHCGKKGTFQLVYL